MTHVAWSVFVCLCCTRESCAKTAELIEMPFDGPTLVGPRNCISGGSPDQMNTFTAVRANKMVMQSFAKLLLTVFL